MNKCRWKFIRRLDRRLITIICITVIPINILAIRLSSIAVEESRERVLTSYEKEFDVFMNREMALFGKLDDWYMDFIGEYLEDITVARYFSPVTSVNIVQDLGYALNMYGINGFISLEEKMGDGRMYVKGTKNLYTLEQLGSLKNELAKSGEGQQSDAGTWYITEFDGRFYYFKSHSYMNYVIGFGIDLIEEMQLWIESEVMEGNQLLIADGTTYILMDAAGQVLPLPDREAEARLKGVEDAVSFHFGADSYGMDVYLISEELRSYVPVAYRLMQVLSYISILMLFLLWFVIRRQVVRPLKILQKGMGELDRQEWFYRIEDAADTSDFEYIYAEFNKMADDILKSHETEIQLYQTRLDNLKLQVNPHMLLNSLTMIYSLAETQQYQIIQKYSMNLVDYFRYCLRETNTLVPLKSEMHFVESYIEIQKIRFPDEFSCVYKMEKGVESALIPPLLVQNFVENAMKYARIPDGVIEVLINIRREGERLLISVSDTGKGMDPVVLDALNSGELYTDKNGMKHIGVWNCRRRLEAFFGQNAVLKLTSTAGEGTQVWIEIPYTEKEGR